MVSVFRAVKPELIHFLFLANLVSPYLHPLPLSAGSHYLIFITWFLFGGSSSSLSDRLTRRHKAESQRNTSFLNQIPKQLG